VEGSEKEGLLAQLQLHQHEVVEITRELARLAKPRAIPVLPANNAQVVLLKARITKHRIDMALLAARLQRIA
jgi:hypothetical protein